MRSLVCPLGFKLWFISSSLLYSWCVSSRYEGSAVFSFFFCCCSCAYRISVRFSESWTEWGLSHGLTKQRAWLPSLLYDCTGTETEAFTSESAAGRQNDRSPLALVKAFLQFRYETAVIIKLPIQSVLGKKHGLHKWNHVWLLFRVIINF